MTADSIDVALTLTAITGVAWTIVYIDLIRIGFRHRTYAMPFVALGLNFAWELTYAALDTRTALSVPSDDNVAWAIVEIVWAIFDIAIVYTFFKFGRAELPFLTKRGFVNWAILVFGASCVVQWLFIAEFGVTVAVRYSAFLQTVVMSGLFIAMLYARRGLRGQTLTIAIAKWIGTLAATILYGVVETSLFILSLGILCCLLDIVYIGLVVRAKRHPDALAASATRAAEPVAA